MYKSPIELICQGIGYEVDKGILKAVLEHGINVDKDELIRALQYDRDQYNKGYSDGKRDAADELVRCKDCKQWKCHGMPFDITKGTCHNPIFHFHHGHVIDECFMPVTNETDFCSYGERRDKE